MSMTDKDLCKAILGWRLHEDNWTWLTPEGCTNTVPNFAHDIEACMKLLHAACQKWGVHYSMGEALNTKTGWHISVRIHMVGQADMPPVYDYWRGLGKRGEESAAIRAAVVKAAEAHAAKGDTDGEA